MEHERSTYAVVYEQFCTNGLLLHLHILSFEKIANVFFLQSLKQDAQLSQRDRAAGCVIVFAKSRKLELGDNISHMHSIGLSSTNVI